MEIPKITLTCTIAARKRSSVLVQITDGKVKHSVYGNYKNVGRLVGGIAHSFVKRLFQAQLGKRALAAEQGIFNPMPVPTPEIEGVSKCVIL